MEYYYTEQKFKKMRQAIIVPNLVWGLLGTFCLSLSLDFQLIPSLIGAAILCVFFSVIMFFCLYRINKSIQKMQNDKLWLTEAGISMSGDMGTVELPYSSIEKLKVLKYQGLPSIMLKLSNGEKVVLGGFENHFDLVKQLKLHLSDKFSTNVFSF